jgi:HAD superfamily hydrolase (TIGR01549 family)
MLKAILFDLDDTLLGNSMDSFIPAYFQALTRHMGHLIPPDRLIAALMRSTASAMANDGTGLTNEQAFAAAFYPELGYEPGELLPHFERFYAEQFPKLRSLTYRIPESRPLVEWAFELGLQVVIATNPLFPRVAVEERLAWAGVPVTEFDYAVVTTYENMHATKPHPAYYREILAVLGREPDESLMVGDNWEHDIVPAASVGIPCYWVLAAVDDPAASSSGGGERSAALVGRGSIADLWAWANGGGMTSGEWGPAGYEHR